MIVCICANINDATIKNSLSEGNKSVKDLQKTLPDLCVKCKKCGYDIKQIIKETK